MNRPPTLAILLALIAAHVVLAVMYATSTPYRTGGVVLINPSQEKDIGAPDERQHANYVGRLLRGEGYPTFNPKDPNLYENYQAHQPPAYYTVARGWAAITGVQSVEARDDGLRLRALNVIIGSATVAGVFFLVLWGYRNETLAVTAAAIAALLPMHVALSGAISNDPMLFALCTWVLALIALSLREGWTWKRAIAVGVLTGVALLTKTTAVALLPILLLAVLLPQERKPSAGMIASTAVLAIALVAPWWMRNQTQYGDPLAMRAFNEAFVGSAQKATFVETIIPKVQPGANPSVAYWKDWVGFWTARSFFGVFGYMDVWLTQSGRQASSFDENRLYWVLILLAAVGLAGWGMSWRDSEFASARSVRIVNAAFFVLIAVLFLRFNNQYFQAQARYLYPAVGPIAAGLAIGFGQLARKRPWAPFAAIVLLLLIVNVFSLVRLGPAFAMRTAPPAGTG